MLKLLLCTIDMPSPNRWPSRGSTEKATFQNDNVFKCFCGSLFHIFWSLNTETSSVTKGNTMNSGLHRKCSMTPFVTILTWSMLGNVRWNLRVHSLVNQRLYKSLKRWGATGNATWWKKNLQWYKWTVWQLFHQHSGLFIRRAFTKYVSKDARRHRASRWPSVRTVQTSSYFEVVRYKRYPVLQVLTYLWIKTAGRFVAWRNLFHEKDSVRISKCPAFSI